MRWLAVVLVALLAAWWPYRPSRAEGRLWGLVALRAIAWAALVAMLFKLPVGRSITLAPRVALDASLSWRAGATADGWTAARAAAGSDSVLLFGDSARWSATLPAEPTDRHSNIGAAADRAIADGRPLRVITDGVFDDAGALARLPVGSTIERIAPTARPDLALAALELPRLAAAGDTIQLSVTVVAGGAGSPASRVVVSAGEWRADSAIGALAPWEERVIRAALPLPTTGAPLLVRAVRTGAADATSQNDSLSAIVEPRGGASAVLISTAPDQDSRFVLGALRSTLRLSSRGYYRLTPTSWRRDDGRAATEAEVRDAARTAPMLVLHGDTSFLAADALRANTPRVLIPAITPSGEFYPTRTPTSPLSATLAAVPWDSLPPVDAAPLAPAAGDALVARLARRGEERSLLRLTDGARRTALVNASGIWRWKLRSARSGELYDAFWGSVLDWLTPRARAAGVEVDVSSVREGEPIAWHTPDDSVRTVVLRGASGGRADTVALRGDDRGRATTPALTAGVYDASWRGGSARIAVNHAAEWVPQRPTVTNGAVGEVAVTPAQPTAREAWWVALIAVLALGAEWIIRRRGGLR